MSEVIFGGRTPDEWDGVIPIPLEDGSVYELPVHLGPLYTQNNTDAMGKVARYKKKSGMPYFHLSDTDQLNSRLLQIVLKGWGSANRNPVGYKCRKCNMWVISSQEQKFYEIARCDCKEPSIKDDDGKLTGTRLPCDRMWPLYVMHHLQAHVDDSRMPRDEDGDPKRVIDLVLDKARDIAYPKRALELEEDDATPEEAKEIEEGN